MFGFIKKALNALYQQFTSKARVLFSLSHLDEGALTELEKILISADTGIHTTRTIISRLKSRLKKGALNKGKDLEIALAEELTALLAHKTYNPTADVYLLVGINGSGKTTFAGKLGAWLKNKHKKVLFVAGDTFRAAAVEQLSIWAQRLESDIIVGKENQDPASVIFTGCEQFKSNDYTALIIDTAGRLQTKVNLMKELEKIKRIIERQLPEKKITILLTVDAMLGQNSFDQAKIFNESTNLDGIILTKMDGTAKGGIVFSISQELNIPIAFISYGENYDQMDLFNAKEYVDALLRE